MGFLTQSYSRRILASGNSSLVAIHSCPDTFRARAKPRSTKGLEQYVIIVPNETSQSFSIQQAGQTGSATFNNSKEEGIRTLHKLLSKAFTRPTLQSSAAGGILQDYHLAALAEAEPQDCKSTATAVRQSSLESSVAECGLARTSCCLERRRRWCTQPGGLSARGSCRPDSTCRKKSQTQA